MLHDWRQFKSGQNAAVVRCAVAAEVAVKSAAGGLVVHWFAVGRVVVH